MWVGKDSESPAIRRDDRIVNVKWQRKDTDRHGTVERNDSQCLGRVDSMDTVECSAGGYEAHRTELLRQVQCSLMSTRRVNGVPLHFPWTLALEVGNPVEHRVAVGVGAIDRLRRTVIRLALEAAVGDGDVAGFEANRDISPTSTPPSP